MASLNRVFLMGNLTRDPELRYIPSGTAVAEFGLAVNREWTDKSGEKKDDTCFVDITVWGRQAEIVNQYLKKGRSIFLEGRLEYSTWETKEGEKRNKLRVVADRVQFLGSPSGRDRGGDEGGGGPAAPAASRAPGGSRGGTPGRGGAPGAGGPGGDGGPGRDGGEDLNLDDIPF
jgi:single-strand DNA-binding protein